MSAVYGAMFLGVMLLMAAAIYQLIVKLPEMMEKRTAASQKAADAAVERALEVADGIGQENAGLQRVLRSRDDQIDILRSTIMQFRTHGHLHALPEGKTDSAQDVVNDAEILSEEDEKYTKQIVALMDQQEIDARQWRAIKQWIEDVDADGDPELTHLGRFVLDLTREPVASDWDDSTTHADPS